MGVGPALLTFKKANLEHWKEYTKQCFQIIGQGQYRTLILGEEK